LWATVTPYELALYRVAYSKGWMGGPADDLRHGLQCAASGGGKPRDWMLDPPKPRLVDFDVGMRMMAAQINAQHRHRKHI